MTVHRWFASKACPGDYLYNLHWQIAADVNAKLDLLEGAGKDKTDITPAETKKIEKGDILNFIGTKQFTTSTAKTGVNAKAGLVKVTSLAEGAAHPYHCRSVDDNGNFIGGVYGWVDEDDLVRVKTPATDSSSSQSTSASTTQAKRATVGVGDKGTDVKTLQTRLIELGYTPGTVDGIFGANTQKATIAFQKDNDLDADGICGPMTWAALDSAKYYNGVTTAVIGLSVRVGPGIEHHRKKVLPYNSKVTIVAENGSWGRLINSAGWVHLDYVKKI